ncbi:MAG: Methylase involved in ubiquinone/menaquinone biosynthesis [bacterium]|nr:Methylase involved in ubiquinone/menaquinone biosynthesis [bacterium]
MDAKQNHQLGYYQRQANQYDQRWKRENPNHLYKIERIARALFNNLPHRDEGYDILEIGGGTGIHAQHFLHDHGTRVRAFTLSDLSPAMLDKARERLRDFSQVDYLVSSAESLATDRLFDGIYMSGAMHHFSSPEKSIVELRKHLRPGGVLVVCEPNVWNPLNFVRAVSMREDWGQFNVTRPRTRALLEAHGLRVRAEEVLHWKGGGVAESLWPYARLERHPSLNVLAVMFLLAASRVDV